MAKKVIRLTEEEFRRVIYNAINESLEEIGGKTHAIVHNATMKAQQDILNGINTSPHGKPNLDVIQRGINMSQRAADSLIAPYKTDYLFHGSDLLGTAALLVFKLKQLYKLSPKEAILKGDVVFNCEPLKGSILVNMATKQVQYNYKGKSPRYNLTVDTSKRDLWNALINELQLSVNSRTV
jgi:hypothetical protein